MDKMNTKSEFSITTIENYNNFNNESGFGGYEDEMGRRVSSLRRSKVSLPFRVFVLLGAASQMILASLGYLTYLNESNFFIYFPTWGPVPLRTPNEVRTWFLAEYLFGLWLIAVCTKQPCRLGLTAWLWATITFTCAATILFFWRIPKFDSTDPTPFYVFSIQFIYHVGLIFLMRGYYKRNFEEIPWWAARA